MNNELDVLKSLREGNENEFDHFTKNKGAVNYLALIKLLKKEEISWRTLNDIYIYDKRLRKILYKIYSGVEESIKAIMLNLITEHKTCGYKNLFTTNYSGIKIFDKLIKSHINEVSRLKDNDYFGIINEVNGLSFKTINYLYLSLKSPIGRWTKDSLQHLRSLRNHAAHNNVLYIKSYNLDHDLNFTSFKESFKSILSSMDDNFRTAFVNDIRNAFSEKKFNGDELQIPERFIVKV